MGGGTSGSAPTLTTLERVNHSDLPISKLTNLQSLQHSDLPVTKLTPLQSLNHSDSPMIGTLALTPAQSVNHSDLAIFTIGPLYAVSRSSTPDTDDWGDAWTDSTVGQTGVNHGNETPLQFANVAVGAKTAYAEINLTRFSGLTPVGNSHTLTFKVNNTTAAAGNFQFAMGPSALGGGAIRPFTESTITQSNQPAAPTSITRSLMAATGLQTITVTLTDAELSQVLGKWALIVIGQSFVQTSAWTTPSREDATFTNRMNITFKVQI